jgi:tRNA dimethylallyltransferase
MDIGTAKADAEEQKASPHHMIDVVYPWENYSVFQYKNAAEKCIRDILERGKVPIIVGGTGLYVNSLIDNRRYSENGSGDEALEYIYDEENLSRCSELYVGNQFEELHNVLKIVDPDAAQVIHQNNTKRVFRALELYFTTGKTQKVRNEESVTVPSEFSYLVYCLCPDREKLYEKINRRVDVMMENGLFEEAVCVYKLCRNNISEDFNPMETTALQAIGYKELIPSVEKFIETGNVDEDSLLAASEMIKQNSRHYAKRQITWFKKTPGVNMITEIEV